MARCVPGVTNVPTRAGSLSCTETATMPAGTWMALLPVGVVPKRADITNSPGWMSVMASSELLLSVTRVRAPAGRPLAARRGLLQQASPYRVLERRPGGDDLRRDVGVDRLVGLHSAGVGAAGIEQHGGHPDEGHDCGGENGDDSASHDGELSYPAGWMA